MTKLSKNSPVDHARIEKAVREILSAVGEDPDREGLLETPGRVARMYAEMFSALDESMVTTIQGAANAIFAVPETHPCLASM